MRKWFTLLALLLTISAKAQQPDIYALFDSIRNSLLLNDAAPGFYLDCTPLSKFTVMGNALFTEHDSVMKYLDSSELAFLFTFIDAPKHRYEAYRTMDTTFVYNPVRSFDAAKLKGAICANDSVRTRIFLSNAFVPKYTGHHGELERAEHEKELKRIENRWDNMVYSFSAPFFNSKGSVFLLATYCARGMFGGTGKTFLYKKVNGQWKQVMCLSVYNS